MAQLPADRTKLALAQQNQVPGQVAASVRNINAVTEAYDTIDQLYAFATSLISRGTLSRLGVINVVDYNASGSEQTTTGSIDAGTKKLVVASAIDFSVGQGINVNGMYEVSSLEVTAGASSSGNCTVTLNGTVNTVSLTSGWTATQVATEIRATAFTGWTTGGSGTNVTFTSTARGTKTDSSYSAGTTGATGTISTSTQGTADFITTISSINGTTLTLADNAITTISGATVTHDETSAIQSTMSAVSALGGGFVKVPGGVYKLSISTEGNSIIQVPSNTKIEIDPNATIVLNGNSLDNFNIFNIEGKDNVVISGGTIIGDRSSHNGVTGEHGMGINIKSSSNITVKDVTIKNCWGDGVYVGATNNGSTGEPGCTNVNMFNVKSINNRRNNCSITDLDGGKIIACDFNEANGTAPQSGLDIEPNNSNQVTRRISIIGCDFINNTDYGILTSGDITNAKDEISVIGCTFDGGKYGVNGSTISDSVIANNIFKNLSATSTHPVYLGSTVNVIVTDNIFKNNLAGAIEVGTSCLGGKITDNIMYGGGLAPSILIAGGANILIDGNELYDFGTAGIRVNGASGKIVISDNLLRGSIGNSSINSGIRIDAGTDIKIDGNTVVDIGDGVLKYGININNAAATGTLIINNDVKGAGATNGIRNVGTSTLFGNNRMKDGTWTTTPN